MNTYITFKDDTGKLRLLETDHPKEALSTLRDQIGLKDYIKQATDLVAHSPVLLLMTMPTLTGAPL